MEAPDEAVQQQLQEAWGTCVPAASDPAAARTLLDRLGYARLKIDTLSKYDVRVSASGDSLVLPYFHSVRAGALQGLKFLKPVQDNPDCAVECVTIPKCGCTGLFGLPQVSAKRREVVLTSDELHCLSIAQETRLPVLALPRGTCLLPQEVLPLFETYTKITLWFGNDLKSWQSAKMFARKLNDRRCFYLSPSPEHPGPAEALRQGVNMGGLVKRAEPMQHKSIVSFSTLREEVLAELQHTEQIAGVKFRRFPKLNQLMRGHRRGELTVFTGSTGSGKTTFLADYSLDLCIQGVNTLWGSFEISNRKLAKMMLLQYTRRNLENRPELATYWADKFERLPVYFLTFHGQEKIKTVLETMAHAVYVYDIEHVVIDNLQFMMGSGGSSSFGGDRFWQQDNIIQSFRKFATYHNCHITLVIHPRKEDVETLNIASIFGGAKASQEADNVLILQTLNGRKYIQVAKNRFDGTLGSMAVYFDKKTRSFTSKQAPKKQQAVDSPSEVALPRTKAELMKAE